MALFDKKSSASQPTRAPKRAPGPQVGDSVFWRGMRMRIYAGVMVDQDRKRGVIRYTNGHYSCTTAISDLTYHPNIDIWGVNGCEGRMPKLLRGEIVDPPMPVCDCGAVTWRRPLNEGESPLCTDCRLVLKASQESNLEGNN